MYTVQSFFLQKNRIQKFLVALNYIKTGSRNIYIFLLKKVISIKRIILQYCVSIDVHLLCNNAVLQNRPLNQDNFLQKKNIFLDPFFMQFYKLQISCLPISIMSTVQCTTVHRLEI